MSLKVKNNYTWALVVPTSMGVRICPAEGQTVASSNLFRMQATSAETNVASISSYLGLPVKVLTTFVKDSQIASFIKQDLRARGMVFEGKDVDIMVQQINKMLPPVQYCGQRLRLKRPQS